MDEVVQEGSLRSRSADTLCVDDDRLARQELIRVLSQEYDDGLALDDDISVDSSIDITEEVFGEDSGVAALPVQVGELDEEKLGIIDVEDDDCILGMPIGVIEMRMVVIIWG